MKRHDELVSRFTRSPDQVQSAADPAWEFLRLGCLNYGDDGPERWEAARQVLTNHPRLDDSSIDVASAVGDPAAVGREPITPEASPH